MHRVPSWARFLADRPTREKARFDGTKCGYCCRSRAVGAGGNRHLKGGVGFSTRPRLRPAAPIPTEIQLDVARARGENADAPSPEQTKPDIDVWSSAAQMATIGIFVILLGATFY